MLDTIEDLGEALEKVGDDIAIADWNDDFVIVEMGPNEAERLTRIIEQFVKATP